MTAEERARALEQQKAEQKERLEENRRNPFLLDGEDDYYYSMVRLRDLFALGSMLAHRVGEWGNEPADIAIRAYEDADAMLKERAK